MKYDRMREIERINRWACFYRSLTWGLIGAWVWFSLQWSQLAELHWSWVRGSSLAALHFSVLLCCVWAMRSTRKAFCVNPTENINKNAQQLSTALLWLGLAVTFSLVFLGMLYFAPLPKIFILEPISGSDVGV